MKYFRCKCGKHTAWSSMGVAECEGCDECKTTLAESPSGHDAIAEHDWEDRWAIDEKTGERWIEQVCRKCSTTRRRPATADTETT